MASMQDFYKGQTVLLTGATGFLGKLLLEKILRTAEDVRAVFILVRPKRGKCEADRLQEICQNVCFTTLRAQQPNFTDKIRIITGDCSRPFLALTDQDRALIQSEVSIILHSAANVKFDTDLRTAVCTNVRAVRDLLELAKSVRNLKSFVHVSTAFSHCYRAEIDEEYYDVNVDVDKIIDTVETVDENMLSVVTPAILGRWPNTYVYTKALAECLVTRQKNNLPVAIVRPAIVASTFKEPLEGWIDNFQGLVGLIVGVSLGVIRSLQVDVNANAEIVPADYVVNTILAVGWDRANKTIRDADEIPIYNVVSLKESTKTWGGLINELLRYSFKYPTIKAVWYYSFSLTTSELSHKIRRFFVHTLFAYIVDAIFLVAGKPTFAVEKYERIDKLTDCLAYFSLRQWSFSSENLQKLWYKMSEDDRKLYNFDFKQFDWERYLEKCVIGGRLHLLKDPLESAPKARRKMYFLATFHYLLLALLTWQLFKFVYFILAWIFL